MVTDRPVSALNNYINNFTGFTFKIEPSPSAHLTCHHIINTRCFQNNKSKNQLN